MNSISTFGLALHADLAAQVAVENTKQFKAQSIYKQNIVMVLAKIGSENNIENILMAEKMFLDFEIMEKQNFKDRRVSLESGLKRIEDAENSLAAIQKYETYKGCIQTSTKKTKDSEGLPNDGFRQFAAGQMRSIRNELRAENSIERIRLLQCRVANIKIAESLYKELQRMHVAYHQREQ